MPITHHVYIQDTGWHPGFGRGGGGRGTNTLESQNSDISSFFFFTRLLYRLLFGYSEYHAVSCGVVQYCKIEYREVSSKPNIHAMRWMMMMMTWLACKQYPHKSKQGLHDIPTRGPRGIGLREQKENPLITSRELIYLRDIDINNGVYYPVQ